VDENHRRAARKLNKKFDTRPQAGVQGATAQSVAFGGLHPPSSTIIQPFGWMIF